MTKRNDPAPEPHNPIEAVDVPQVEDVDNPRPISPPVDLDQPNAPTTHPTHGAKRSH